jgi:sensor histidine kinase YesM
MTSATEVVATPETSWRVISRELRQAPRQARRALLISFLGLDLGLVVAVADLVGGGSADELHRLASVLFAIFGASFLVVAQILHQVSQGRECRTFAMPRLDSQRYHRALVAVPLLAVIAAIFFSLSIGILLTRAPANPWVVILVLMIFLYLVFAARFVHLTTTFLNQHAAEQAQLAARAQAQATEARLAALQSQMNPHFLFNALNTVAALVRTNGRAAEATVEHLAEVLRHTLDRTRATSGTVGEEIDYLRAYLAIEQERFGDRLRAVEFQLDQDTLQQPLPPLALQPLVENALRHGIGARLEGGAVAIEVARNNGQLVLSVSDNGIGFPPRYREGTGLGNLRQRLSTLYGERSELRIESTSEGSRVTVIVPASEN